MARAPSPIKVVRGHGFGTPKCVVCLFCFVLVCDMVTLNLSLNSHLWTLADEIRKTAGNAGIKTFTSKLDQGLMTDAVARGETIYV